ncbi:MAG: beta-N-acetylhexosaminidase [Bacteroidaceae bacterium]|nr:beta-N-acetylhexosaminidase [Bacteroidaceae bacterium]
MKRINALFLILFLLPLSLMAEVNIIPLPTRIVDKGGSYILKPNTTIAYNHKSLLPAAEYLREKLKPATGYNLPIIKGKKADIILSLNPKCEAGTEGYKLTASTNGILIEAADYRGIIHGIATLRQLLPFQIEEQTLQPYVTWMVPTVEIEDTPNFEWRGMMLDPVRHFFTIEETKRLLDIMALYKFSKFHWHLVDSQGWRLEIKQYPLLTSESGFRFPEDEHWDRRCNEIAKNDNNPRMTVPMTGEFTRLKDGRLQYGGFYTQDEVRDLIEYATVRGIDIVPEFDVPGHSYAATKVYPWLSCNNDGRDPICVGKDTSLEFCRNVYKEIFDLFPYEYVEIGGDEVNRSAWKKCADCQKRIQDQGVKDEAELQSWFTCTMEKYFNENGKKLIGWDEILEGGVSKSATVNWWRGDHADVVQRSTSGGNEVILCPFTFCYFDYAQDNNTLKTLYTGDIVPTDLNAEQLKLIKGMQGNIWCERIPTEAQLQYMVFPRALALAEKAWTKNTQQNWDGFYPRLLKHVQRLNTMGVEQRGLVEN